MLGSVSAARLLLNAGAEHSALNTLGETPLTTQLRFGTIDCVQFLLDHGADPNLGARGHMPSGTMEPLIQLMLRHGWDINKGQLLHDANHGHGKRVITWLRHGANPNAATEQGQTALHLLAARGSGRDAIAALVQAGADIHARDHKKDTPLSLALRASSRAAEETLRQLGAKE